MEWALVASPEFQRDYRKLCGRNAGFKRAVDKKLAQILENPFHFKQLRAPMHHMRRVHVMGSYVIVFNPVESSGEIRLERLAHHDDAYTV